MQKNILTSLDITKICLNYIDGKKNAIKEEVTIKFIDEKACYFIGRPPINFTKPGWRAKAEVVVYTKEGIYSAVEILRDVSFSLESIVYKINIPKKWEFKQMRAHKRKQVELPLKIKFNDGSVLEVKTFDLSLGGFSFISKEELSVVQSKFVCSTQITIPNVDPEDALSSDTVCVRQKAICDSYELKGCKKYSFKFVNLSASNILALRNFLNSIY